MTGIALKICIKCKMYMYTHASYLCSVGLSKSLQQVTLVGGYGPVEEVTDNGASTSSLQASAVIFYYSSERSAMFSAC